MSLKHPGSRVSWPTLCAAASVAVCLALPARAADMSPGVVEPVPVTDGLACDAASLPWLNVWLGHFSGGKSYYQKYTQIVLDWQDQKLCFPSKASCDVWIHGLRREYHRPEGYWTCLPLR